MSERRRNAQVLRARYPLSTRTHRTASLILLFLSIAALLAAAAWTTWHTAHLGFEGLRLLLGHGTGAEASGVQALFVRWCVQAALPFALAYASARAAALYRRLSRYDTRRRRYAVAAQRKHVRERFVGRIYPSAAAMLRGYEEADGGTFRTAAKSRAVALA